MASRISSGSADSATEHFRYETVIDLIKRRIAVGHLRPGDKLPSLRSMAAETGFSIITVHRAYELLESQGICLAKERSGFFVNSAAALPAPSVKEIPAEPLRIIGMSEAVLRYWNQRHAGMFGAFIPDKRLFRRDLLDKLHRSAIRSGSNHSEFGQPPGERKLQFQVAKRAAQRRIFVSPDQVVITRSGTSGLNLCLDLVTSPGDTVLVESPAYFPMLSSLHRRHLRVVEIYSSNVTGIDCGHFRYLVEQSRPSACILTVANRFPTGISYPDVALKELVKIATDFGSKIIENDMFSELSYAGGQRSLKEYDMNDTVIQFSSFANFVAPEYGLGWVIGGKHAEELKAVQFANGLQGVDAAMQKAIADYLDGFSNDRQVRRITKTLQGRMDEGLKLVREHFPEKTRVSAPHGGYMCWVRLPKHISATQLFDRPAVKTASFLPGEMFSVAAGYSNYIAMNFSGEWTAARIRAIADLGGVVRGLVPPAG
ncbi:PLP-dependent aminotransferase family protein [Sinorhizobium meliloti]|uniref:aminotransferase-like domain-containing protein n=1 Tax=Rhizobium meliloti TaxID=382 RepID=UPI00037D23E6|nr:PLP-dependent aminotransferase family protein [Sinorhizobium meliloti]